MGFIVRLLKSVITKMILCFLLIVFVASLYFYKDWYVSQYHKVVGYYYVYKGDKAYKDKNYTKAVMNYRKALELYPGHYRASWNLGNIYVSFENYYEAVNAYERALKYSPNFMVCRMDLGIILAEELADYDKAIQEYGRVANSHPFAFHIPFLISNKESTKANKGVAYYNIGKAYRSKAIYMGDKTGISYKYLKKARDAYEKAEKYLKDDYDNTFNLAFTNHLLGDYHSAAVKYCKAINLQPRSYEAHYNFALLLRSMEQNDKALDEFEKTTLLLDDLSSDEKIKAVYGLITELKRRIINTGGYEFLKDREDINARAYKNIKIVKGKVVSEQKEEEIQKLFLCPYTKEFAE
ncbi:tetratricopeptide repeat protein [bacterium]|nr:tetratricopeptide repeat protein [bacterium]